MADQSDRSEAGQRALKRAFLLQALEDVLGSDSEALQADGCDLESLEVLRQTAQVAEALQQVHLEPHSSDGSRGRVEEGSGQRPADACPTAAAEAAGADAFSGMLDCQLGVGPSDLLAEALPSEAARRQALAAALPALEAALFKRCAAVAAASGYGSSTDFSGLPDHMRQLQAAISSEQAVVSQAEAWQKAADKVGETLELLARGSQLLADITRRRKLEGHKEADEAQASALHSQCTLLREKLRVVQLQLQEATYTAATVPVLHRVSEEVEQATADAAAQLQQATARLAQYKSLGPRFAALAAEHGSVLEALEEAEFELREIEQFRVLAAVTG